MNTLKMHMVAQSFIDAYVFLKSPFNYQQDNKKKYSIIVNMLKCIEARLCVRLP